MLTLIRCAATLGLIVHVHAAPATAAEPQPSRAEQPETARVIRFHTYEHAIELTRGSTRAVLCPQVGGRVLEFSVDGRDAMYLDPAEKTWTPGSPPPSSAGRFDYGPELTVIPHPALWSGEWS